MMIGWITTRKLTPEDYLTGSKQSPWYIVAFGMIGDSLSGVTFISVPGWVGTSQFSYLQMVLGYLVGYYVIANLLLPLYYRLNLVSIYSYFLDRFGHYSQKTGSFFFLISRLIGAAFRLYLTASVIQFFVFDSFGFPFWLSVSIIIALILLYTYKGGIKTLVWTDTFQSSFLILGVVFSVISIAWQMDLSFSDLIAKVNDSPYSKIFFSDWKEKSFFPKQFLSGAFIAIVMTGLDQNMMQKNLSCPNLKDAQKNILWFSVVLVFVNIFFLSLGAMLYIFAEQSGIQLPIDATGKLISDRLFPELALNHLGTWTSLAFILGLTAATFSSADSVLTTLTTSFSIDFLGHIDVQSKSQAATRRILHFSFAVLLLITILIFKMVNDDAVINAVFTAAGYTYGPLLGLFGFGLFTKRKTRDVMVPFICILSPVVCYLINVYSESLFNGYKFGFEMLLINGMLTFGGLFVFSRRR